MVKYCAAPKDSANSAKAKAADMRVHFKNTWQVGRVIRGMAVVKAQQYLEDVILHKRCIPYIKFSHAAGRTPQAKEWGLTQGRWPRKSVELFQGLLKNAVANADQKGLDTKALKISHLCVQRAQKIRRRTYRAHGRIGAYMASPCHAELILEAREASVPKPTPQAVRLGYIKPPAHKRFGDRAHRCTYK
eukprot:TRINITY_DN39_c0_g3_i1.p2 TRINITY_DN39_c0_g3~~TRINITY_DN39_c0_g3_i1.p2  ORF type:complete len:189 (+),score=36.85 TRINITY_DN39_c0_g3_i1:55-621(+)